MLPPRTAREVIPGVVYADVVVSPWSGPPARSAARTGPVLRSQVIAAQAAAASPAALRHPPLWRARPILAAGTTTTAIVGTGVVDPRSWRSWAVCALAAIGWLWWVRRNSAPRSEFRVGCLSGFRSGSQDGATAGTDTGWMAAGGPPSVTVLGVRGIRRPGTQVAVRRRS